MKPNSKSTLKYLKVFGAGDGAQTHGLRLGKTVHSITLVQRNRHKGLYYQGFSVESDPNFTPCIKTHFSPDFPTFLTSSRGIQGEEL